MLRSPGLLETARRTWGVRHIFAATLAGRFLRTINSAIWLFFNNTFFSTLPSKIIVQVYCCHTISKHVVHHYHAPFRCGRFASIKDGQVERRDNDAVCQLGHMLWLWYVSPPPSLFQLRWNPRTILQHAEQHVPSHRRVAAQHNCIQACY